MTCGCTAKLGAKERQRARAATCGLCAGDSPLCPASGRAVELHVRGVCPRGKYPDHAGRVRWLGVWWVGLPWPKRAWLWTSRYSDRDPRAFLEAFPGCGCLERLKGYWTRLEAAWLT